MSKFYNYINFDTENTINPSCNIDSLLKLIEGNVFSKKLKEIFADDISTSEKIILPGLSKTVESLIEVESELTKVDIICNVEDITVLLEDNQILLEFTNFSSKSNILPKTFKAELIYSTKTDFLDEIFKIKKFYDFCVSKNETEIALNAINELIINDSFQSLNKQFRILIDTNEQYFLRAITSTDRYKDYNVNFSAFVTFMALHQLQGNNSRYSIHSFTITDSLIDLQIEDNTTRNIPKVGKVSRLITLTNDEIKSNAFKISYSILIRSENIDEYSLILKPESKKIQNIIISIKHSSKLETTMEKLGGINKLLEQTEKELIEDINKISNIKEPDQLRFYVEQKVNSKRTLINTVDKNKILNVLKQPVNNITELLKLFGKVSALETELETSDYIKYLMHTALTNPKDSK